MRILLAATLSVALAASALAQGSLTHTVPLASEGHTVELVMDAPDGAVVSVVGGPAWAEFERQNAETLLDPEGSDRVARLTFHIAEDAPVGAASDVTFEVRHKGAFLATHSVSLVVGPPAILDLGVPRPNPARGPVVFPLLLPEDAAIHVAVYDVLGREAIVLADGDLSAGRHTFRLGAGTLAPGTYIVRVLTKGPVPDARVRTLTVVR